jgi:hypothetical protein
MDNLSAHKGEEVVRELISASGGLRGALPGTLLLSGAQPEIEEAFSKIKGLFLRKAEARTPERR